MAKQKATNDFRISFISMAVLAERVNAHCKATDENLSDFYNRAVVNQLEREGDFDIRTIIEETEGKGGEVKWL